VLNFLSFISQLKKILNRKRIDKRATSPLVYWKISENDLKMLDKWDAFTLYKEQMFKRTSYDEAPWIVLNANNKKVAILSALRFILNAFDYPDKDLPKPKIWSEGLNNYKVEINKVLFENLSYKQYKTLRVLADE
jgi:hypothetical protein